MQQHVKVHEFLMEFSKFNGTFSASKSSCNLTVFSGETILGVNNQICGIKGIVNNRQFICNGFNTLEIGSH